MEGLLRRARVDWRRERVDLELLDQLLVDPSSFLIQNQSFLMQNQYKIIIFRDNSVTSSLTWLIEMLTGCSTTSNLSKILNVNVKIDIHASD